MTELDVQEIRAKRVAWEGRVYDSQLEADWHATLASWGVEVKYHPGRIPLGGGGWWEPDFLATDARGEQIMLEAKGPHDDRLWKTAAAARETGLPGVVLRPGLVPAGSEVESAGAVWHGPELWGLEWVVAFAQDGSARWTCAPTPEEDVRVSAERCIVRPSAIGLGMRKALTREVGHG